MMSNGTCVILKLYIKNNKMRQRPYGRCLIFVFNLFLKIPQHFNVCQHFVHVFFGRYNVVIAVLSGTVDS